MTEKFDPIDQGAKYGSEHRMSLADAPGRKNSRRKLRTVVQFGSQQMTMWSNELLYEPR